jgi:Na+-translocating ferredoxin:NAD+ oxidoreductase RNF subunit RnfB
MESLVTIALAGGFLAVLGVTLACIIAVANRKLFVYEDPRIDEVEEMLPHSNCGACGTPGCRQFAEALVKGTVDPGLCTVGSKDSIEAVADFLGVEAVEHEKRVARLACSGGSHVAYTRASYTGLSTCHAANLVAGGGKGCTWGCLGFGDCGDVCGFDAIQMNKYGLPEVNDDKCTACGDCVDVCPKDLFSLQPVSHRLWVACVNRDPTDVAEAQCDVVCNGCARCTADAPEGLITMQHNLAVIDYSKNDLASQVAIERCPTGAIVWVNKRQGMVKGVSARKVVRKEPLPRGY